MREQIVGKTLCFGIRLEATRKCILISEGRTPNFSKQLHVRVGGSYRRDWKFPGGKRGRIF